MPRRISSNDCTTVWHYSYVEYIYSSRQHNTHPKRREGKNMIINHHHHTGNRNFEDEKKNIWVRDHLMVGHIGQHSNWQRLLVLIITKLISASLNTDEPRGVRRLLILHLYVRWQPAKSRDKCWKRWGRRDREGGVKNVPIMLSDVYINGAYIRG